jgi:hypothetical protein
MCTNMENVLLFLWVGKRQSTPKKEREKKMDMRRINSPRANRLLTEDEKGSEKGREGSIRDFYGMNFMRLRKRVAMRLTI